MIPADILTTIITFLIAVLIAALVSFGVIVLFGTVKRKYAEQFEPSTYGDDGGHPQPVKPHRPRPKAPETGSGLPIKKIS